MEAGALITQASRIIRRDNGSEVRIHAQAMFGAGLHRSIDVYVHRRDSADHAWTLCNNRPHPDSRTMSVDDYVEKGRSEQLRTVTPGEILSVSKLIGQPMVSTGTGVDA